MPRRRYDALRDTPCHYADDSAPLMPLQLTMILPAAAITPLMPPAMLPYATLFLMLMPLFARCAATRRLVADAYMMMLLLLPASRLLPRRYALRFTMPYAAADDAAIFRRHAASALMRYCGYDAVRACELPRATLLILCAAFSMLLITLPRCYNYC